MRRICGLLVVMALVVQGLAACRGSSSGGGGGSSLSVAVIGTFQAPGTDYRDGRAAVEAKADQINAAGGINGKKIKITACDDQHDPNQATRCARDAVSAHVLAVLAPTSASGFGAQIMPVLNAAKIPVIGSPAVGPADWTSPNAYPLDPGSPAQYAGVALALKKIGCTDVGSIQLPVPAGEAAAGNLAKGVTAMGGRLVKNVKVGMSEASYASQVAQLVSAGAKCIVPIILPTEEPKLLTAVRQSGKQLRIGGVAGAFNQQLLTSLGSAAEGIVLASSNYLPTDTSVPAIKEMTSAMAKYTPDIKAVDIYGSAAWGSATLLFDGVADDQGNRHLRKDRRCARPREEPAHRHLCAVLLHQPAAEPGLPEVDEHRHRHLAGQERRAGAHVGEVHRHLRGNALVTPAPGERPRPIGRGPRVENRWWKCP
jgi:ABC-type branched-subunit amino acid transport system substrate-binding protein